MAPPASPVARLAERLRSSLGAGSWARNGAWTILDQALFAGANFVVSVLLARWLSPEGYGAYTVAYTVFILLGTVHGGLVVEPMLVFGSGRFEKRLGRYLRVLLSGHAQLALVFGAILGAGSAIAWALGQAVLAHALAAFAVGQAAILFQWTMRSACFVRTQPALAAASDGLYAVLVVGGAFGLRAWGVLDEVSAVVLISAASLAAGLVTAARLGVPARRRDDADLEADARAQHRSYGGWAASTGALEWVQGYLPFVLLPLWAGLAETGALRALFNLVMPVLHASGAITKLLVPSLVRAEDRERERAIAWGAGAALLAGALGWALLIGLAGRPILDALYDGQYNDYAHLLWMVGALPLAAVVANVAMSILRARERPADIFAARLAASGTAGTVGAALVFAFGVAGALLSDLVAVSVEAAVMLGLLRRGDRPLVTSGGVPAPAYQGRGDGAASRRSVLMVAYAAAPDRGSEPGIGWEMATRVARHHDVTALVYSGFRRAIEAELAARPVPGLRVVYERVPFERGRHHDAGADRAGVWERVHYHLWQLSAGTLARRLHRQAPFDVTHHVTLASYWSPSAAALEDVPFLWGPVGGGEAAPVAFLPALSRAGRRLERRRAWAKRWSPRLPSVRRTVRRASRAVGTTPASAAALRGLGVGDVAVRPAVAVTDGVLEAFRDRERPAGPLRVVSVGRLVSWKGFALGLEAFAGAVRSGDAALEDAELVVVGDGPERRRLARLARALEVGDRVTMVGAVPRARALEVVAGSHVLLHPSLHDSGGFVTLEAMAAGLPVVCLDLGGPALQVTPETGVAVAATSPAQAVAGLEDALRRLAADPALCDRMGRAGRARVQAAFRWDAHVAAALGHYAELLGEPPVSEPVLEVAEWT